MISLSPKLIFGPQPPGGSDTYVQFNDGGAFGGNSAFVFNKTTGKVSIGFANLFTLNTIAITTGLTVQSNAFAAFDLQTFSNSATLGATTYQLRARGTNSALAAVQSGDYLSQTIVAGYDGTDYALGGYMLWAVDDTPGSNDMPTAWSLWLTPNGSQTPANAVTIASTRISSWTNTMNITPDTDLGALVLKAGGTSTSVKTLSVLNSSNVEWFYLRKGLLSDSNTGSTFDFTTSGSGGTPRTGFVVNVAAGYTGGEFTGALAFDNAVAGTATYYLADATTYGYRPGGNRGFGGFSRAVTTGHNIGGMVLAGGGAINYGLFAGATITKASAINVGVFANAHNASGTSPAWIGLYATCFNTNLTTPPNMAGVKTALLADNQTFLCDIGIFRDNGFIVFNIGDFGLLTAAQVAQSSGALGYVKFTGAANTGRTASTEVTDFDVNLSAIQTWATGALTLQRMVRFRGATLAFVGASTVTDAINVDIEDLTAGTNATLTRQYALRTGSVYLNGGQRHKYTATAGDLVVAAGDYIIGVTSTAAARTITLPDPAVVGAGKTYRVKDESGGAAANNITIQGAAGNVDGAANVVINTNYGSKDFYTNGINWFVV